MSTAEWPRHGETLLPPPAKKSASRRPRPARAARRPQNAGSEPIPAPAALADFLGVEVRAIDAEKWPVFPVMWWQPDLARELPKSSGLRNERRNKTPVAGFMEPAEVLACPRGVVAMAETPLPPELPRAAPASDLTPLGWDPRTTAGGGKLNGRTGMEGIRE